MSLTTIRPTGFYKWEFQYCPVKGGAVSFTDLSNGELITDPDIVNVKWAEQRKRDTAALEAYTLLDSDSDDVVRIDTIDSVILSLGDQVVQVPL